MIYKAMFVFLVGLPVFSYAEMKPLAEEELDNVSGQGGVYLTGEFSINKDPGPLWKTTSDRACGPNNNEVCGLRLAVSVDNGGSEWYVLDNVSGGMSFEGLTLRTEHIDQDEKGNAFGKEVLKIGLPGKVKMNDYKFTFAFSNKGAWENSPSFKQTDIFGIQQDGDVTLKGNLILFPTD